MNTKKNYDPGKCRGRRKCKRWRQLTHAANEYQSGAAQVKREAALYIKNVVLWVRERAKEQSQGRKQGA